MNDHGTHINGNAVAGRGTLYVVSTPLGNLEDITLRALKTLKDADIVAAESVNRTRAFCNHYAIDTMIVSYNQHNSKKKTSGLLADLKAGKNLALVTDAGTPGISDPGINLVDRALREGIRVSPIPGPSAVSAALSVSGMPAEEFVFFGFLSNKSGKRKKALKSIVSERRTMVFFEAPHRLHSFLSDVRHILGDRNIVMVREMTKVFEEVRRGSVSEVIDHIEESDIKGECTLVVAGSSEQDNSLALSDEGQKKLKMLLGNGNMSIRDIANLLSQEEGLPYRHVYKECLAFKRDIEGTREDGVGAETENKK